MAKDNTVKLDWQAIDTGAFTGPVKTAWDAYVKARTPINAKIEALKTELQPALDNVEQVIERQLIADGVMTNAQEARFAYRFGGMAVAVVDATAMTGGKKKLVLGSSAPANRKGR